MLLSGSIVLRWLKDAAYRIRRVSLGNDVAHVDVAVPVHFEKCRILSEFH